MAEPPEYDGTNVEVLEPIGITKDVDITLIEETPQPEALNVRMVKEGDDGVSSGDDRRIVKMKTRSHCII